MGENGGVFACVWGGTVRRVERRDTVTSCSPRPPHAPRGVLQRGALSGPLHYDGGRSVEEVAVVADVPYSESIATRAQGLLCWCCMPLGVHPRCGIHCDRGKYLYRGWYRCLRAVMCAGCPRLPANIDHARRAMAGNIRVGRMFVAVSSDTLYRWPQHCL